MNRFKIDIYSGRYIGLFVRRTKWFGLKVYWELVSDSYSDDSMEKLKICYQRVKDLPEYLP